jgi:branched-chain amino acid transport system substrate-binding protein
MSRLLSTLAGIAALLFFALAGQSAFAAPDCGLNTGKPATGKPIPVGAVTSMTGFGSFVESDKAVIAYFKCVNANGGIYGRPLAYQDEDDQSNLQVAAQAAKKLVEDRGVYMMVGSAGFFDCIANARYYIKQEILEVGVGISSACYQAKNIAEVNAGARQSLIGAADYARRKFGIKSLACSYAKGPDAPYVCGGVAEWGKKYGVKVTTTYFDPTSPDLNSLVLQLLSTRADAALLIGSPDTGAQLLNAVEQQDGAARMKWLAGTPYYTVSFPEAIDSKYWNKRIWVNVEAAPLDSTGPENRNWWAVEKAYGGPNDLLDSISQLGYVAARIAVRAMLTIKNPDEINRKTVTAALQNMKPYSTDLLCGPWYWGGPDETEHNANHATRIMTIENGKWKQAEGCVDDADPGLAPIEALEAKLGIRKQ